MEKMKLSQEQISILKLMHRNTKNWKKRDRIKTILFLDEWFTMKETARLLLLDEDTVSKIKEWFLTDWIDKFLDDNYVCYLWKLTEKQKEEVKEYVRNNIVMDAIVVIEFIKKQWNIEYSRSWVIDLLYSLNFTYKKTKLIPSKAKKLLQAIHIFQYRINEVLKTDSEITIFIDWVHPHHNCMSSYWWIEIWEEKHIKSNTWRDRININWAYCLETQESVIITSESINAQSTIELYKKIEEKYSDKQIINIYRDNAKYYANNLIKEYLKTSKIREIPLPPYSPNLNPIERLWLFMKKNLLYNKYYEKFSDFKEVIQRFFGDDFHLYRDKLKTFITDDFQVLGF